MVAVIRTGLVVLSCSFLLSCTTANIPSQSLTIPQASPVVDNLDGTITDKLTSLQWTKDDLSPGPGYCYGGTKKSLRFIELYLDCLNRHKFLGHSDWRLPTHEELESLRVVSEMNDSTIFASKVHERLRHHEYMSTTDVAVFIHKRGIMVYNLIGPIYIYHQKLPYYVWPVRSAIKANLVASSH